ncbi:MAG: hypothetical protein M1481_07090 [Candidatus Thermoplasmatota archaeon]|jgi:predicted hydrocarbon binding protein|nr:hypothetical protein [Candidatus Thermoplasmatota archaeon]MCL5963704.1 hypothetical protein [Candidatus Thermoplasmatota archaeon]
MRYIKISQDELKSITQLYESVMSHACHGLFFREGRVYGEKIVNDAKKDIEHFFDISKKMLIEDGWVTDVHFGEDKVYVSGSFEIIPNAGNPTCHRLRGIIREIYETKNNKKVHCVENECVSIGNEKCVFAVEYSF